MTRTERRERDRAFDAALSEWLDRCDPYDRLGRNWQLNVAVVAVIVTVSLFLAWLGAVVLVTLWHHTIG